MKMKNFTELCRAETASPVPVLTAGEQGAVFNKDAETLIRVESAVDDATVTSRFEAAYAAMTSEQIKSLSWTDKIRLAQGIAPATAPAAPSNAAVDYTKKCLQARNDEKEWQ
jgi:hypothetical protein